MTVQIHCLDCLKRLGYGESRRAYIPETNHFYRTPTRVETALFGLARLQDF